MGDSGQHFMLHVAVPIQQQLEWLDRVKAPYLLTYPSNAMALAEAVTPESGRKLGIELVLGHAETVPDGVRDWSKNGSGRASRVLLMPRGRDDCGGIPMTAHYHVAGKRIHRILADDGREVRPGIAAASRLPDSTTRDALHPLRSGGRRRASDRHAYAAAHCR